MFWSTPKCPVEPEDKLWLEESMEWLLEEFGSNAFRDVISYGHNNQRHSPRD